MTWSRRVSVMGLGEWIGRRPVLRSAGLAVCLAASGGPPAPLPGAPPVRALFVYPAPSKDPGTPFLGVIGDSTATQLTQPLAATLNPRGVGVVGATVGGCQPTDTVMTFGSAEYFQRHLNCPQDAREKQNDMVYRFHPWVVLWADILEWSDIKLGDRTVTAGTAEWKRLMTEGWDRTLSRLGGADLVLVLPTWWAGWPLNSPPAFPVEQQRVLFRTWAARYPRRVTVVDLGPVICPAGPPCQQVVDGVELRSDHVHYTPEGTRRAIAKILADAPVLRRLRGPLGNPVPAR
jgi:hypothetical protein